MTKTLTIARICGSCGGVRRALELLRAQMDAQRRPIWLLHDIVHNTRVMQDLRASGVRVAGSVAEIPDGALVVLSAHGTTREVEKQLAERRLEALDAVCPLVLENRRKIEEAEKNGFAVVLCGKSRHAEVAALLSRLAEPYCIEHPGDAVKLPHSLDSRRIAALSQTTLDEASERALKDALKARFSDFTDLGGVCGATAQRQNSMREACAHADFAVVIGSPESSNSQKLAAVASQCGVPALLVDDPNTLAKLPETERANHIALTAGASVPDELLRTAEEVLRQKGFLSDAL